MGPSDTVDGIKCVTRPVPVRVTRAREGGSKEDARAPRGWGNQGARASAEGEPPRPTRPRSETTRDALAGRRRQETTGRTADTPQTGRGAGHGGGSAATKAGHGRSGRRARRGGPGRA